MKKPFYIFFLLCLFISCTAQVNHSILPKSSSVDLTLSAFEKVTLPPFNLSAAEKADLTDAKNGELPKFSRSIFTHLTLDNSGSWTPLNHGRLWRLQVTSKGAQALLPYFDEFYLPPAATLHVYTPDKSETIGAFTSLNNPGDGRYATGLIHGESLILEYYEPEEAKGEGKISLSEVGHAYRWVSNYFPLRGKTTNDSLGFLQSDNCEVNVNCFEGANWQQQKRAVVCIVLQSSLGQGICNGTLMNNVRRDCTPYILSAQHCTEGVASNQYSQWLFYFNYEAPGCVTPSSIGTLGDNFIAGCTKKADSNDNGGESGSDFLLLQLNNQPPASYNAYYAGWNRQNIASDSGVCIHHPEGDVKKISTYTNPILDSTWWTVPGTHWLVQWSPTLNGHGVTEFGSSGAPLFNKQGQVIGKLTGGESFCNLPNAPDYFGKLWYDWMSNGPWNTRRLQPWLDPDNTGLVAIVGRQADCMLSISEAAETDVSVRILPNPTSGSIQCLFENPGRKLVLIYNSVGSLVDKLVTDEKELQLNMNSLANGMYFFEVLQHDARTTHKIILSR